MNKTIVLLDLEETLIESFDDALILEHNILKIAGHLYTVPGVGAFTDPESLLDNLRFGWMSWAIWDWSDKEQELVGDLVTFIDREHKWNLKERMSTLCDWSMTTWAEKLMQFDSLLVHRDEINQLFSKEDMLFKLRDMFNDFDRVILFDDTVEHNLTISAPDVTIVFQNIKEL